MAGLDFSFAGALLTALPTGALFWRETSLLCVSDLHLGKSERLARGGGALLPPYETRDTLARLEHEIEKTAASTVICLGDSFDDLTAADKLNDDEALWLMRLMAGRQWIWIAGNHDPGPLDFGGTHLAEFHSAPLSFRHVAKPDKRLEISGHFHPKARLMAGARSLSRPCFLYDSDRVIMPAFGTYTGGLRSDHPVLTSLMQSDAKAIMLGRPPQTIPMPRG